MIIRLAEQDEVDTLTRLSTEAFDTDVTVGGKESDGPPNYNSVAWHEQMRKYKCFYTILENDKIVGGILVFPDHQNEAVINLGRIFIDPKLHHTGLGFAAMLQVEKLFPTRTIWQLDTPIWNIRTNSFYPKLGYKEMKRDEEFVYYQKEINV